MCVCVCARTLDWVDRWHFASQPFHSVCPYWSTRIRRKAAIKEIERDGEEEECDRECLCVCGGGIEVLFKSLFHSLSSSVLGTAAGQLTALHTYQTLELLPSVCVFNTANESSHWQTGAHVSNVAFISFSNFPLVKLSAHRRGWLVSKLKSSVSLRVEISGVGVKRFVVSWLLKDWRSFCTLFWGRRVNKNNKKFISKLISWRSESWI